MKNIFALVERELRAYFISPIAYVILTIFTFVSGIFFQFVLSQALRYAMGRSMQGAQTGQELPPFDAPGLITQSFLGSVSVTLLFVIPIITMALFSEEKRRGTLELLLTAPLTDLQVVLGKFCAAAAFYTILLASTWIPMAALYVYGSPASGPILTAYLGLLLYGFSLVSIGMFISTLTENQIIAAILSFGTTLVLWLVETVAGSLEGSAKAVTSYLSVLVHLDDFMKGILSTTNVIFYLSLTFLGLFLTYRSVDSMRWRG